MIQTISKNIEMKYLQLKKRIAQWNKVAVACSGGVDSTLLLHAAVESLGEERVVAFHLNSGLHSQDHLHYTRQVIKECFPQNLRFVEIDVIPFNWSEFRQNSGLRCYHCKKNMYEIIIAQCQKKHAQLLDGTNRDDLQEDRPGLEAVRELGVETPLADVGLKKTEIRILAKTYSLKNWNLPSNSCYATRIPHGLEIEPKQISLVERCETYLGTLGYHVCRVRIYGKRCVIELVEEDFQRFVSASNRRQVLDFFIKQGLSDVSLNLKSRHKDYLSE